jgi:hypothetical protein
VVGFHRGRILSFKTRAPAAEPVEHHCVARETSGRRV